MISSLKVYTSYSLDPYENLATERFLLDYVPEDCCILYLWQNEKTVVIGKNQNPWLECNCPLLRERSIKIARRLSGGGAVYHDVGNLNFTFLNSAENYNLEMQLEVIKTACLLAGIKAEISGRNDVLAEGRKFSGNAFYNAKGKAYHHGTLLICADTSDINLYLTPPKAKLKAKGVKSVKSRIANLTEFVPDLTCKKMAEYMRLAFEQIYGIKATDISSSEIPDLTDTISKYSSWDYIYGATFPFTISKEAHFSWGHINLQLQVDNGIISEAKLYTDSLQHDLAEITEKALKNCKYEKKAVGEVLFSSLPQEFSEDFLEFIDTYIS